MLYIPPVIPPIRQGFEVCISNVIESTGKLSADQKLLRLLRPPFLKRVPRLTHTHLSVRTNMNDLGVSKKLNFMKILRGATSKETLKKSPNSENSGRG